MAFRSRLPGFLAALLVSSPQLSNAGLQSLPRVMRCVALAACMAFAGWLFYPMLGADFWALDDHELVRFLPDGRAPLGISDALKVIVQQTEVGKPFSALRYRPSYYVLRLSELYLWHLNSHWWFAARFCMVLLSFALLVHLATGYLGPLCGGLLALVALTPTYWGDIWGRTGPAEEYATLGLALFCVGTAGLLKSLGEDKPPAWAVWLLVSGCILAAGSKELFIPMCLVPAWCVFVPRIRRKLTRLQLVSLSFTIAYCLLIAWSVCTGISRNAGTMLYGQHADIGYFERATKRFMELSPPYIGLMLLVQVLALVIGLLQRTDRHSLLSIQRRFVLAEGVGLAALFWVIAFYAGDWPRPGTHYNFPGLLLAPACAGLCLFLLDRTLALGSRPAGKRFLVSAASALGLLVYIYVTGFPSRPVLAAGAKRSRQYQDDLTTTCKRAAMRPTCPIVISVAYPSDDETVFATRIFLHAKGVANPFYVIGPDVLHMAGGNSPWLLAAQGLESMMEGKGGFRDNRGLAAAVAAAGGAYVLRVSSNAPTLGGATELPLRWN